MRALAVLPLVALAFAGCLAPEEAPVEAASTSAAPAVDLPAPETLEWSGHVLSSELDGPSHFRPTEDAIWSIQQEGVLVNFAPVPQALEVALEWTGGGELMIMLHSHKEHGTNVYVEHITEMDDVNPKCLRVPTEDLTEGEWQVMIHSNKARDVDFTLKVATVGSTPTLVTDDRHGHWPQDGTFEVDKHEIEPCQLLALDAAESS